MAGKEKKKSQGSRKESDPTAQDKGSKPLDAARLLAKFENQIKVIHGANDDTLDNLVGRKVADVREALTEAFGIPGDAVSLVNGERVDGDYILQTNDVLEFIRTTFVKPPRSGVIRAKLIFDNGAALILEENGEIVGTDRRIRGAIRFNKKGQKVDSYFTREVTTKPETIPWKFKDGTQRTKLYDDGGFIEGSYIVGRDDGVTQQTLF